LLREGREMTASEIVVKGLLPIITSVPAKVEWRSGR
jgi:hypothetical protein